MSLFFGQRMNSNGSQDNPVHALVVESMDSSGISAFSSGIYVL